MLVPKASHNQKVMFHLTLTSVMKNAVVPLMTPLILLHHCPFASLDLESHVVSHFEYLELRNVMVQFMMASASHDGDTGTNGITWPKCHVSPHFNCLDPKNAMLPLMMQLHYMMLMPAPITSDTLLKSHVAPHFNHLDLGMQWCNLWHHWHHVISLLVQMAYYNQESHVAPHFRHLDLRNAIVALMMPVYMTSYDQKSHVASHFDHLDLRDAVVPLMMPAPMASHDQKSCCTPFWSIQSTECNGAIAHASTNCVTWPKSLVAPHSDCLNPRNAMVPLMVPSASYDADTSANGITWQKSHAAPHFKWLNLRNVVGTIGNVIDIVWCPCQCQLCHMTKNVMLNLTLLILT